MVLLESEFQKTENNDAKFIKFPLKDQDKTEQMIPSELQVEK